MALTYSVVIATHNGSRFIERQLRTILDQTIPSLEILVGDDASSDGTCEIVDRIIAEHPRGRLVRLERRTTALGVVRNFEVLLRRARGDLIALADQDDAWRIDRMEQVLPQFDSDSSLLLLHHDARLVDEKGESIGTLFDSLRIGPAALDDERLGRGFDRLLTRNLVTGATTVLRRGLVAVAGDVPVGWIHDEWLAIVAAALDGIAVDSAQLVDYRQHGGNQIGATRLSLSGVIARFRQDGIERNQRLLIRAQSLVDGLNEMEDIPSARRALSVQKLHHERMRSSLPRFRGSRLYPVLREWRAGGYNQFGNGLPDAVRDLVQPHSR